MVAVIPLQWAEEMHVVVGLSEDAAAKITAIGPRTKLAATAAIPHSPNSSDSVVDSSATSSTAANRGTNSNLHALPLI
jgi:hypothetical protein